jgi:hypothetical protein
MTSSSEGPRPTAFTWNLGGWLGSQLGGTLWILILGLLLVPRDFGAGSVCLGVFVLCNLGGFLLWRSRQSLSAYAGLQGLLAILFAGVVVVYVTLLLRGPSKPPEPGALVSTSLPLVVVVMFPALMLLFYLRERSVRRRDGGNSKAAG